MSEHPRLLIFSASFGGGHQSAAEAMEGYAREHHPRSVDIRIVDYFKEFAPAIWFGDTFWRTTLSVVARRLGFLLSAGKSTPQAADLDGRNFAQT